MKTFIFVLTLLLAGSLTGCATYSAQPLSTRSTLPDRIPDLTIDPRQMPLPELAAHTFDPTDELDITEVAMLAVVNNPDLKIARAAAGVVHAQAFAAGLLPDPRLALRFSSSRQTFGNRRNQMQAAPKAERIVTSGLSGLPEAAIPWHHLIRS